MSDLGELSAELRAALDRLERVLESFRELDRRSLAPIQARAANDPQLREVAALVARARTLVRRAGEGIGAARMAGEGWLARHGAPDSSGARAAWDGRLPTPGGMAYYPAGELDLRNAATALPPFPGEYTLDAHGSSACVEFDQRELSASEIAELIRVDERWGGRPVRLFSCNTGSGENPVAQELAELLNVRVVAPDDFVWSAADGWVGVAPIKEIEVNGEVVAVPDRDREGRWRVFDPPTTHDPGE